MVTICTITLTSTNSTFCPHSVLLCFVWISEQTSDLSAMVLVMTCSRRNCWVQGTAFYTGGIQFAYGIEQWMVAPE